MAADRDLIIADILELVRRDVEYLILSGKDPDAVAMLLTQTLGSMRALAQVLNRSKNPRECTLSRKEVEECATVRATLDEGAQWWWDQSILSGAHPLALARRVESAVAAAYVEPDDDPMQLGL